jgi:homoserine dehydrogenase
VDYGSALASAQQKGFAEADPSLDVEGHDAAQKLAILSRLAFNVWVDSRQLRRQGISNLDRSDIEYAKELGYVIKSLAVATRVQDKLHLRVGPTLVAAQHPLAVVRGEYNAVRIVGEPIGSVFFSGPGAGGGPTASSVVADVIGLATRRSQPSFASLRLWENTKTRIHFDPDLSIRSRFYLRFTISDRPGVIAQIANVLGQKQISISSVIQHEVPEHVSPDVGVPLVIMTHHADERAVREAVAESHALDVVRSPTICLHVFDEPRL